MEALIFLVFGLLSSLYSAIPLLIVALVVILLVRKNNKPQSDLSPPYVNEIISVNYERGVRDTLERVKGLDRIDATVLQGIERALLPGAFSSPGDYPVVNDPSPVDTVPIDDEVVEPQVYPQYADEQQPTSMVQAVATPSPVVTVPPPVRPTEKTAFNGLNVLLLLSSLLFVAAGIAFIASPFADGLKLAVLMIIVGLFYGGGMGLYWAVKRLRPAAVAFIGTGLALIPFLGVAFAQYTSFAPEMIWLIVSLLGMTAYLLAALTLKSQVVSYLTIGFLLSLVGSAVANVHAPLNGYFVAMIGVSLVASIVGRLRSDWVPAVFRAPVEQTGNIVTPVALGASLLFGEQLRLSDYEIIFALTTLHYIVARLQTGFIWHEQVARVLAHITLLLVASDLANGNLSHFGIWFAAIAGLQAVYSLWRWRGGLSVPRKSLELVWVWVGLGLQVAAPLFWTDGMYESGYTLVTLALLAITGLVALVVTKRYEFGFVLVYAGLMMPGVLGNWMTPTWQPAAVGAVWLGIITALIGERYMRGLPRTILARWVIGTALVVYTAASFFSMVAEPAHLASAVGLVGVAIIMLVGSYAYRVAWTVVGVAAVVAVALVRLALHTALPVYEMVLFVTGLLGIVMYALSAILLICRSRKRGNISLVIGHGSAFLAMIVGIPLYFYPASEGILIGVVALLMLWAGLLLLAVRTDQYAPLRRLVHSIAYPLFYLGALVITMNLPIVWQAGVLVVGVALVWEASYRCRQGYLILLGNVLTVWATIAVLQVAGLSGREGVFSAFIGSTALFYAAYSWFSYHRDNPRRDSMLVSAWICVCIAVSMSLFLEAWQQGIAVGALIAMTWHASYVHAQPSLLVIANAATVWLGLVIGTLLRMSDMVWYTALLGASIVFYGLYHYYRLRVDVMRRDIMAFSTWVGMIGAWLASLTLAPWWQVIVLIGLVGIWWEISYAYRKPWTVAAANVTLCWLLLFVVRWQWPESVWGQFGAYATFAFVLYAAAVALRLVGDTKRQMIMLWSVWLAVAVGYITSVGVSELQSAASLLAIAGGVTGIEAGVRQRKKALTEIATYATTIGLMTLIHSFWPSLNSLLYVHLAAGSLAVMAWWRGHNRPRYVFSLGLISLFSAGYALDHGAWYSLLFLLEHIAVTIIGTAVHRRWVAWWGAIGSVLAVFYYLRESPYLIFALLGVLIVGFVVWRLSRKNSEA